MTQYTIAIAIVLGVAALAILIGIAVVRKSWLEDDPPVDDTRQAAEPRFGNAHTSEEKYAGVVKVYGADVADILFEEMNGDLTRLPAAIKKAQEIDKGELDVLGAIRRDVDLVPTPPSHVASPEDAGKMPKYGVGCHCIPELKGVCECPDRGEGESCPDGCGCIGH